jgi:hypothetical protein
MVGWALTRAPSQGGLVRLVPVGLCRMADLAGSGTVGHSKLTKSYKLAYYCIGHERPRAVGLPGGIEEVTE